MEINLDSAQPEDHLMDLSFEVEPENGVGENAANINDEDLEVEVVSAFDNEADSELNVCTKELKRNKFKWVIYSEWDSLDEALDFLESEGFVNYDYSDLKSGQKFYFRCKVIPQKRKEWCAKRYTLFMPSTNMKVLILYNQCEHNHDKLLEGSVRPPSDEMIEFITDLFKCGTTKVPDVIRHIDYNRTKHGLFACETTPGRRQVEYMLRKYRDSEAPPMIKVGDIVDWCEQYKEFPSNVDEAFVFGIESSSFEEDLSFRFAFSTPRLLDILSHQKTICIDATYKLNWLGYPLMVLGTVDRTKRFHPFVYACCSHERTHDYQFIFDSVKVAIQEHFKRKFEPEKLIADGADQIRNAFYRSYESAELDVMCYAHVIRNCRKRPFTSKNNKQLMLDDVRQMQLAPNTASFNMMTRLFCEKWQSIEADFVAYFRKEWLGVHCNWYEGAADYTASTNNGQESHNAVIKRKITLRRRLPINQFLVCMRDMTAEMSQQFSKGERAIAMEPKISKDVYEKAALMLKDNFKAFKAKQPPNSEYLVYSLPSTLCANPTEAYYKTLVKTVWKSFDEFIVHGFQQFYILKFSADSYNTKSTCTCTAFFKHHICKHIVAIAIRLNVIDLPNSANPVLLAATKRTAGRPRLTTKALSTQT